MSLQTSEPWALQTTVNEAAATQIKIWALPHPGPYRWFLTCQEVFPSSQKLIFECILQATSLIANLFTVFPSNPQLNPAELLLWPQLVTTICWLVFPSGYSCSAASLHKSCSNCRLLLKDRWLKDLNSPASQSHDLGKDGDRQGRTCAKRVCSWS